MPGKTMPGAFALKRTFGHRGRRNRKGGEFRTEQLPRGIQLPQLGKADIIEFSAIPILAEQTRFILFRACSLIYLEKTIYSVKAAQYETLPDVLTHAGVDVLWLDNNSGYL